jgi:RimJ/RimL family protein N-acetyltransferase
MDANPQASHEIFACVFQDNPGTARVLVNCGYEYLGDAEAHSVARGVNVPTWTYMRKM